jgi:hypothetical protein
MLVDLDGGNVGVELDHLADQAAWPDPHHFIGLGARHVVGLDDGAAHASDETGL